MITESFEILEHVTNNVIAEPYKSKVAAVLSKNRNLSQLRELSDIIRGKNVGNPQISGMFQHFAFEFPCEFNIMSVQ